MRAGNHNQASDGQIVDDEGILAAFGDPSWPDETDITEGSSFSIALGLY